MNRHLLISASLLLTAPMLASASQPEATQPRVAAPTSVGKAPSAPQTQAQSRRRPCQGSQLDRTIWPQGTLLWGASPKSENVPTNSAVLASVNLSGVQLNGAAIQGVRLQGGRLVAPSGSSEKLLGAIFQGADSDGQPVEVALCDVEPSPEDPTMEWYRIEIWKEHAGAWETPCLPTEQVPAPRVLAMQSVWDDKGTSHKRKGQFTFACENGAIAKCVKWGYKPWIKKEGRSLEPVHQACTRMARADYCGDGRSHTVPGTLIDMYDALGLQARTTEASDYWEPEKASFEAAWATDGAWCVSRTRQGEALETIVQQCPERFLPDTRELGQGDRCAVRRKGARVQSALLRNHSYGP
ncbi:MAG: hypothetical protein JXB05_16600 [Myxococcaceae bacterium]|nr:hypothetical protein [Myxococcaceae bacterium]